LGFSFPKVSGKGLAERKEDFANWQNFLGRNLGNLIWLFEDYLQTYKKGKI